MLLLQLMATLFPQRVRAIYVNHQLQSQSSLWGQHVADVCSSLNIPCVIQAVDVSRGNLEQQARHARYVAYQQHLQADEILVLAHHQQDQAETLLLRLFSGAGVAGLCAMKTYDVRDQFNIWRPFLELSRQQIELWVRQLQLDCVVDPTNMDTHYDRAWCRETLWPVLEQRFPKMQQAITRTTTLMQDADAILNEVLQQDQQFCGNADQLDIAQLQQLSLPRQRQLLSVWMKGQNQYRPSLEMVQRLQREVIESKVDRQAALHCAGYYYLRYQQQLYRLSAEEYKVDSEFSQQYPVIELNTPLKVASGLFNVDWVKGVGLSPKLLGQTLCLTARQGGEKIHLHGRVGSWPLKKAIQDAKILPWQRQSIQILSIDNVMLGVFTPQGFWLAQSVYCLAGGWLPKLV